MNVLQLYSFLAVNRRQFAAAAVTAMEYKPDIIDINMGCPAPKISGNGAGSALMKNPDLCGEIVEAVCKAVDVPITVKIRKGWDDKSVNAVEVAKICEQAVQPQYRSWQNS